MNDKSTREVRGAEGGAQHDVSHGQQDTAQHSTAHPPAVQDIGAEHTSLFLVLQHNTNPTPHQQHQKKPTTAPYKCSRRFS